MRRIMWLLHRAEPYKPLFLWLCANYCGILKAENDLSGRWFSWRRRRSTRKRLFLVRQSIRTRTIGLSEHPAKASLVKKFFSTPMADLPERSAKASWARNTILTKMGILSRLPVTAFSEPRSQLIRTGNTWGRAIRGWDQITILDGETDDTPEQHSGAAIGLLFFVICIVVAILMFVFRWYKTISIRVERIHCMGANKATEVEWSWIKILQI